MLVLIKVITFKTTIPNAVVYLYEENATQYAYA